ncbi:1,4-alpha-glucan branching enzyme [Chitinophaga terrae (ex Kim and Jung 2007)]|uniref:1,4-alpha-glucan branching enzyme GlgB n=1 Tax=Chitinophaga terrae (ex Kim and Jung 2007) TaxID=408074 RepID=A0A1H3Z882_9BACT|nr:1,4-alpha-glucan branching protein GlgB [Chitinophaga terrae (ex Kim and Jung 2007)]GEP88624.1 1,4-alpha-glucan branching enzyme GlgB [Chitinophaga terrae (ex Kim and Jung 2007)]SEA19865.1 1,4-alpha-glucan branching enzyme [Chitinophaga terrae (ex Kim and Jung 2007)]
MTAATNNASQYVESYTLFSPTDITLFQAGSHYRLYEKFGAHPLEVEGAKGTYFAVWAPDAAFVSVIGDFNGWDHYSHTLYPRWDHSGIWEGFVPGVHAGQLYKYFIRSNSGEELIKGDPYANYWEVRPKTASIVSSLDYEWDDEKWMQGRKEHNGLDRPFSVYEVHLGSWRKPNPENPESVYTYQEMAEMLVPYVKEMGFTHVELMPVMEHPFDGSWGYQITGYFAPTSRYGTPQDFMEMVEAFHLAGIGVILDWVPSHFPYDGHGLYRFDGSHVYEYADMRKGFHPDWNSYIFNYARNEVRSFLLSNAVFWLDKFHADGLRVDAIASMIHLNYSRQKGAWEPNEHGGIENLEAISFLKKLNETVYALYPDVQTIAEDSTSHYGVSRPTFLGGLGFGMKWMMGWMNDTLDYFKKDPIHRKWYQNDITFSLVYAFSENYMLPLSHDEVVHGKSPLLYKMPGDDWQKFANLRLLYAYMFTHPGTKLLFMGDEFGQTSEWNFRSQLDWHLLQHSTHKGLKLLVQDLNAMYRNNTALYDLQFDPAGFEWITVNDYDNCVLAYTRKGKQPNDTLLVVLNMTPVARENYLIGLPIAGTWEEVLNTDAPQYYGSGVINTGPQKTYPQTYNGRENTLALRLPPLGATILRWIE